MDSHAQHEIRSYAVIIGEQIVAKWVPAAWEAFLDYRRNAVNLSCIEAEIIKALAQGLPDRAREIAMERGLLQLGKSGAPRVSGSETRLKTSCVFSASLLLGNRSRPKKQESFDGLAVKSH